MRNRLITWLKIVVTAGGLAYVILTIPVSEIAQVLVTVRWGWLLFALFLAIGGLLLRALRWMLLLRGLGAQISLFRLTELYFVGNFFNAFLPSGFGGDAVRVVEMARNVPTDIAAGTVIVDRLTGLLMLFGMALIALPFRPNSFPDELTQLVATVCVLGIIGGYTILDGRLLVSLGRWLPEPLSPFGRGPVARLLRTVSGTGWRAIIKALLISVVFNLVLVGWWLVATRALSLSVSYTYLLLVVPIMSVALLVPSIGGLGLREYLAPLLFAGAGLEPASAVALSLTVFAINRTGSLLGAPVYIWSLLREPPSQQT